MSGKRPDDDGAAEPFDPVSQADHVVTVQGSRGRLSVPGAVVNRDLDSVWPVGIQANAQGRGLPALFDMVQHALNPAVGDDATALAHLHRGQFPCGCNAGACAEVIGQPFQSLAQAQIVQGGGHQFFHDAALQADALVEGCRQMVQSQNRLFGGLPIEQVAHPRHVQFRGGQNGAEFVVQGTRHALALLFAYQLQPVVESAQVLGPCAHLGFQPFAFMQQVARMAALLFLQGGALAQEMDEEQQRQHHGGMDAQPSRVQRSQDLRALRCRMVARMGQQGRGSGAHRLHFFAADVGHDQRKRSGLSAGVMQRHGFVELRKLFIGAIGQGVDQGHQLGARTVVDAQLRNGADDIALCIEAWNEVVLALGQQIAPLRRLGIHQPTQHQLHRLVGVVMATPTVDRFLRALVRPLVADKHGQRQQQAKNQGGRRAFQLNRVGKHGAPCMQCHIRDVRTLPFQRNAAGMLAVPSAMPPQ